MTEWKNYVATVGVVNATRPLPGHLAPLDKRHRWLFVSTTKAGDFWYRCRTCHRRKLVRSIVNLLARKMRDAAFTLDEQLSETLYR